MDPTSITTLLERSFHAFYGIDDAIDWTREATVPESIAADMYRDSVSQLYHAEVFAVRLCTQTALQVANAESRDFLLMQAIEEGRHARMYERYAEKLGGVLPVNPAMAEIYDTVLAWSGHPIATILALNFFIEGEAIHQQAKRIRTLPCPLFRDINRLIIRDEGRHHAFGAMYVRATLPTVPRDELVAALAWIKRLWTLWEANNESRYAEDTAGVIRNDSREIEARFTDHLAGLAKLGIVLS